MDSRLRYWSRYITVNRYTDPPKPVYQNLLKLVKDKDYFVLTTNVDHCFQKAGFDKKRLFYTQGDYGLFQCSEPCCRETFDIARCIMPDILAFYESEEGQREFAEWKERRETERREAKTE